MLHSKQLLGAAEGPSARRAQRDKCALSGTEHTMDHTRAVDSCSMCNFRVHVSAFATRLTFRRRHHVHMYTGQAHGQANYTQVQGQAFVWLSAIRAFAGALRSVT